MSSAQVGKTEIVNNIVGYFMSQDPSPVLLLQPTLEMAEAWSKDRLAPMVRDTPALKGLIKDARSRDSGNTLLHKQFPGGHITMAGANSPASLASRPIRIVLCDEVDRYALSAGAEGDRTTVAVMSAAADVIAIFPWSCLKRPGPSSRPPRQLSHRSPSVIS
jgi:phage terminase large subunit GpA-like protein